MLIKQANDIRPSEITNESDYRNRREFLARLSALGAIGAASTTFPQAAAGIATTDEGTTAKLTNVIESPLSDRDEELTDYDDVISYNNFYEFGTGKGDPCKNSKNFQTKPWSVQVNGECAKPGTIDLEDLISPHQLEERIHRFRCVEAWSMVIPWIGIPLADVLKRFEPSSNARYVAFSDFARSEPHACAEGSDYGLALRRRLAHRRGDASPQHARCRLIWPRITKPKRRAFALDGALEVWIQKHQIHCPHDVYRETTSNLVEHHDPE